MWGWYIYPLKTFLFVFYSQLNTFQSLKSIVEIYLPKNSEKGAFLIADEKELILFKNRAYLMLRRAF